MSPTQTRKGARLYRYYVSQDVLKLRPDACPVGRVPATEIDAAVIEQLRGIFRQPEIIVGTWRAARAEQDDITEDEAREALTQLDPLWIGAHCRMFAFLGGVPRVVVPDNLKAAVTKADRFDPGLNRTYAEMAAHYGTAILPARPRKPRDKAKVEVAVQVAQRWILARLRNRRFFALADLNAAIWQFLDELNTRVMRGYGASRADLFATLDRPHLRPLPDEPYAFARWKRCRVAPDYHVEVDSSWYSVPFRLIRQEVDVRVSGAIVEFFHRGTRVASHPRTPGRRSHVTVPEHMPSAHRRHAEWSPARMLAAASKLGPSVAAFCEMVMADRPHPEQGFRTCLGVLALAKSYDADRVDAACRRGLTIHARSVASIRSILKTGLDRAFLDDEPEGLALQHANIRGQGYYH